MPLCAVLLAAALVLAPLGARGSNLTEAQIAGVIDAAEKRAYKRFVNDLQHRRSVMKAADA